MKFFHPVYIVAILLELVSASAYGSDYCSKPQSNSYEFTRQVIIKKLAIQGLSCPEQEHHLKSIKTIDLSSRGIENVKPLLALENIEIIKLKDNNIKSAESLLYLNNIRELDLSQNKIESFNVTRETPSLEVLRIDFSHEKVNIRGLGKLSNIKTLSLKKAGIRSVSAFFALPESATTLDLSWNSLNNANDLIQLLSRMNVSFFPSKTLCMARFRNRSHTIAHICEPYLAQEEGR